LSHGQAVAAYQLLQEHADKAQPSRACLLRAQALLAMGRTQEAAASLGVVDKTTLNQWPQHLQGAVAAVLGEAFAIQQQPLPASQWLTLALKQPSTEVAVDRLLLLLAETLVTNNQRAQAEQITHALWRDWPRSPYRARAGLLEARLLAERSPDQARSILAGVRAVDHLDPHTHLAAAELLCRLLLEKQPTQCLGVAEQAMAVLGEVGSLLMWRAMAMVALDPQAGLVAIQALPKELQETPAVMATRARIQQLALASQQLDAPQTIARARAEIAFGRPQAAVTLLLPLAAHEPAALMVLASIPGQALEPYIETPAIQDPLTAQTVGVVHIRFRHQVFVLLNSRN
jgi:hypothetical protein